MEVKLYFLVLCASTTLAYDDVTVIEYINTHSYVFFKNLVDQAGLTSVLSATGKW